MTHAPYTIPRGVPGDVFFFLPPFFITPGISPGKQLQMCGDVTKFHETKRGAILMKEVQGYLIQHGLVME